ncbi:MAG TPA: pitrilysin family protein [Gammaproteobacteria bacterium]|nr:pitrilysin family protein [Gammaproteobacteria bacterium]
MFRAGAPKFRLLLIAWPLFAVANAEVRLPDGIERVTSVEGITEYRLDNGLRALLFPDPSKATITVNVTYLVGSVHESYGETGMAHLLEHMLFKGSTGHTNILKELQDRGAQANGTTAWDRTNYFETFDASEDNLAWALDLEADRMVNSFVAQADLDSEMTVVRNEFESGENNPIRVLLDRVLSTAYLWHGYGNTPIGSRSDIENVPIERLQAFYRRFYQPDNAVLVIAGRIDEARTLELLDQTFGAIPRPERVLEANYTEEPVQDGEREVVVRRVGNIQALMAGYHTSPGTHSDFVPLQIAAQVLTDAPSGRLYKALVEPGIAAQVATQALQLKDPGLLILIAIVRQDGSLDRAREVLLATIDDLKTNPITEEEVTRAKNEVLSAFEQQMNNSQGIAIQLSNWASIGDWRMLFVDRDRVRKASAEDVQRAALQYLKASNRTVGVFIPGEPDRTDIPDPPDLAALLEGYGGDEARAEGEAFDATPANIDARTVRMELPGGVKLVMLPKETRGDSVNALIRLNFGDEQTLMGTELNGPVTAQMLMRGTSTKSRQQIEDELNARQSQLNIGGGADNVVASIQTTREHLAAVLELAIEVLREPAFPEGELRTLRDLALTSVEFSRSEPQAIVQRAFTRHWSQRHARDDVRYARTVDEELASLNGVSVQGLREFHERFYGASHAEVVVVGDFDPSVVERVMAEKLDGWESPQAYTEVTNPYPDPPIDPVSDVFETPDKENAFLMAGMPIKMSDEHPDYAALVLGNYIFGQGPSSRLFGRIRNREGLSYGVGSQFQAQARIEGARFLVNAISAPQNTDRVEASFRDELAAVLRDGYGREEVAAAKASWAQLRQVARSQDPAVAGMLLANEHNGRTMAWDTALEERVRALTVEEIRDAMRRHLDLERMAFMKGGDFAGAAED